MRRAWNRRCASSPAAVVHRLRSAPSSVDAVLILLLDADGGVEVGRPDGGVEITVRDNGIGIAGVMGGADTEVTNGTRRVLLESAYFLPASIRRTSRASAASS